VLVVDVRMPGMLEAGKQFRRVNGHLHLPALRKALEAEVRKTVRPVMHDEDSTAA
jgi:putative transposase